MVGAARARRAALGVLLALTFAFACAHVVPSPAHAVSAGEVTLNEESGGQPSRFTIVAVTDEDTATVGADLAFPEGFDVTESRVVVDVLRGTQITHVPISAVVKGSTIQTIFKDPVPPKSQLRVLVYDVGTLDLGKVYALGFRYDTAGGQSREAKGLTFEYRTAPPSEKIMRWLDDQPLVQQWNKINFLSIFLRPQTAVEALALGFAGWLVSIGLVAVAFPIAIVGGLILAFCRMSKIAPLRWISGLYVNVIRGTPLFLQIYIAFVGLPLAGVRVGWFPLGVAVLALNSAAYLTEIFRAGIQSINKGQFEAASSLGMTYMQAMQHVIIPQTVKRVLPTMTSEFILLFKDTALLFPVGVFELMMYSNQIVARTGTLTPFVVAAGYYLVVTIPLIYWVQGLERKLAISEGGQVASVEKPKKKAGVFHGLGRTAGPAPLVDSDAGSQKRESR